MVKPNYKDGSILNLIASIEKSLGSEPKYNPLKILKPNELKSKNTILLVIDGLGFQYLTKQQRNSTLAKHVKGKITSTFPSSTSAAAHALLTGRSAKEHGMTGWYTFLKEIGSITIPLPHLLKATRENLEEILPIEKTYNISALTSRIKCQSHVIQPHAFVNSSFTKATSKKAKIHSYRKFNNLLKKIRSIAKSNNKKKFIFAYYGDHDILSHQNGLSHKKVKKHFKELDENFNKFLKSMRKTDSTIIVTADHGMVNVPKDKVINLENHPKLKKTLTMPLCGEARFAYCYVKPFRTKDFERYVKTKLKNVCTLHKSETLASKNFFGLNKAHPNFLDRIGDYTLIMKEDYAIYDTGKKKLHRYNIGDHGGTSKEEMYVPLIVIET